MSDLYGILGVDKDASADEIKRAYRKAALVNHPDRGGDKATFQALQGAYDVLSDPEKRQQYDMTGNIPQEGGPGSGGMPDLSSIFGSMFGGGMGMPFFGSHFGSSMHEVKPSRGPNKIHEIGVSLTNLYKGKRFTLNMKRDVLCGGCGGKGGTLEQCKACKGNGFQVRGQQMGPIMAMTHEPCGRCAQTGSQVVDKCGDCSGKRVVETESALEVVIQPGMNEGDRITFVGKCSESPMFATPGDVVLVIRSATGDNEGWVRRGADLTIQLSFSLAESLLGWERDVEGHPSERPLHLVWKGGVLREGEVLRIPGWGMPLTGTPLTGTPLTGTPLTGAGSGLGELRIVCHVEAQGAWSEEQLRALKTVWSEWKEPVSKADSITPVRP